MFNPTSYTGKTSKAANDKTRIPCDLNETLKDLRAKLESTHGKSTPTCKKLRESGLPVINSYDDGYVSTKVYQNGFAEFHVGNIKTTVAVDRCGGFSYKEHDRYDGILREREKKLKALAAAGYSSDEELDPTETDLLEVMAEADELASQTAEAAKELGDEIKGLLGINEEDCDDFQREFSAEFFEDLPWIIRILIAGFEKVDHNQIERENPNNKRHQRLANIMAAEQESNPSIEENAAADDTAARILALLSEQDQEIAKLLMSGFNQKEIANLLGISQPRVSTRIKHMRITLGDLYERKSSSRRKSTKSSNI